jgi:hypothetical protein
VKLTVGAEATSVSERLVVQKDPNSEGTEADINAQSAMLFELRKDMEGAADMVNQIEVIRTQLASITSLLEPGAAGVSSSGDYAAIKQAANDLDKKLIDVEENLIQRRLTGQGQDTARWPPKLISKISYLVNGIGGADFPPTAQHREVKLLLEEQLATHRRHLDDILNNDVANFNKQLRDRGIQNVIAK